VDSQVKKEKSRGKGRGEGERREWKYGPF